MSTPIWSTLAVIALALVVTTGILRVVLILAGHDGDAALTAAFTASVTGLLALLAGQHVLQGRS